VLTAAGCATLLAGGEAQLERSWQSAQVWLPEASLPGPERPPGGATMAALASVLDRLPAATRIPVVLYAHDCGGPGLEAAAWGERLSRAGYAVIAPDSRARSDHATVHCARSDAAVLATRQGEIRYALRQIKTLPWVRHYAVFLLAVGEGAAAAARDDTLELTGSIVIGQAPRPGHAAPLLRLARAAVAEAEFDAVIEFLRRLTPR
jgi:hypothetical protein